MQLKHYIAIALLICLGFFIYQSFQGDLRESTALVSGEEILDESEEDSVELQSMQESERVMRAEEVSSTAEEALPVAFPEDCVVFGRVVDVNGEPVVGASVVLAAYKVWTVGLDVPRIPGRLNQQGFEQETDLEGKFWFGMPVPSKPNTSLRVTYDRFHESAWLRFVGADERSFPPLIAGERDLGDIMLGPAGAIRGKVTDSFGKPLENTRIFYNNGGQSAQTDAMGEYVVAGARAGSGQVQANLDGYLSGERNLVVVELGKDTSGIDFELRAAPTIEGWIHDELGNPLEGAKVSGWPVRGGRSARAKSDTDGSFKLFLPQDGNLTLQASKDGYATWGDEHDSSTFYEPGTRGLQIILQTISKTRFVVLDAESGVALNRFGLRIDQNGGSQSDSLVGSSDRRPPVKEQPNGVAEASGREGLDAYAIAADGYPFASGDIEWDQPGVPVQTVHLEKGGSLQGRVFKDSLPVGGARVEVVGGFFYRGEMTKRLAAKKSAGEDASQDADFAVDSDNRHFIKTDAQGQFKVEGLEGGLYKVVVTPGEGTGLIVEPFLLSEKQQKDLGKLTIQEGASVMGQVHLPDGVSPVGLKVLLGDWRSDKGVLLDADARFALTELAPGNYFLSLKSVNGVLARGVSEVVSLAPGEAREIVLDARDHGMCQLSLTVTFPAVEASKLSVWIRSADSEGIPESLGACDAEGKLERAVRALGLASIGVRVDGVSIPHPTARINLTPGGTVNEVLRFEAAGLAFSIPEGVPVPALLKVNIELTPEGPNDAMIELEHRIREGKDLFRPAESSILEGMNLRYPRLPPGTYRWKLVLTETKVLDSDTPGVAGMFSFGGQESWYLDEKPHFERAGTVVLKSGETTQVSLQR